MLTLNQRITVEFIDDNNQLVTEVFGAEQFAQDFAELIWRNPRYRLKKIFDRYAGREIEFVAGTFEKKPRFPPPVQHRLTL